MTEPHATPGANAHKTHEAPSGHAAEAHDDDGETPLGPVDAQAWGAGLLGVAVAGLVAVLLYVASYH